MCIRDRYVTACEYLQTGNKWEKNPHKKEMVKKKLDEYCKRAEEVKQIIDNNGANASNDGGVANKPPGAHVDDEEKKKRMANLDSALVGEKPDVTWDDVAGLEDAKELLQEAVITPQKFPHLFTGKRKAWKGVLLYGPPGTGKSFLAKAIANEADSTFYSISATNLTSKWMGESEKLVSQLFESARENSPSIIFIDEIDAVANARGEGKHESSVRMLTQLLVEMDGVGRSCEGVMVLAATNCPWDLDQAMRRRLERRILIPLPDETARMAMFKIHAGKDHSLADPEDFRTLAKATEGYSGSDIGIACKDALMMPVKKMQDAFHFKQTYKLVEGVQQLFWVPCSPGDPSATETQARKLDPKTVNVPPVSMMDFAMALKSTSPSVTEGENERYFEYQRAMDKE
eukprot:TRINITY_DN9727_c0_g1_i5.p1 TRINITY_DN9727_c0_g1~~TRINITY_DN9727_c0_g1_i5.p1  ORF type:complete len:401 (+),score=126.63 TRINITY_DN9727_c0_g1_i5:150-1352(+)